tara:strand:- start:883 stop:1050 length:168 start_codon:yes stop_codon:yes gene_type:complete
MVTHTEKVDSIENERDACYIGDVIREMLEEKHGRSISALSFEIIVDFQFEEEDEE